MLLTICEFLLKLFAISIVLFVIGVFWKIAIDEAICALRKRKGTDED